VAPPASATIGFIDGGVGIVTTVLLNTESLLPPPQVSALSPPQSIEHDVLDDSMLPPLAKLFPQ